MRRLLLMMALMSATLVGWAQTDDVSGKLSVTTQMFLDELNGNVKLERDTKAERQMGLIPADDSWNRVKGKNAGRIYAAPDTINGKAYIAAYVRLSNAGSRSELEALGVIVQEEFNNGLVTTLIPVDKIGDVAGISNVKRINVSALKRPFTKTARQKTNVDDVLTLSTDAISAGLSQKYDGSGVVLGVIDTGIDFNHIAFKDASGNSRIKQAYVYNGSTAKTYTGSSITSSLTDDNTGDHGTHTSTTAGGSSVIASGTTVTVTDDHANATYGGMAPGADLYLAGINGLSSTYLDNAVKNMCNYADAQGKPLVVSNSWGSQFGPHDGTGDEADVYNSLFGDSHPNRVALFAASNDGGKSKDNEGGGYHLTGTASSSSPLRSILRCASYTNTDAGYYYYGIIANAWCRSTSVSSMTCKIYVLDSSTGAVKTSVTVSPTTSGATVSGLSSYFSGTLYAYKDYVSSSKTQILLYTSGLTSKGSSTTTKNGSSYYKSSYTLAVEFAPSSGSATIDVWGGDYGYFTNHLSTSGYTWTAGSDDGCFSDEATIPNVISIGAYVSANTWKDYSGTSRSMADVYTLGDIAYFSSWGTAGNSPAGTMVPWISAPGARLAAGVNHNHTTSVDDYSYYGSDYKSDLVVNSSTNPYAMMEGTSMATPTAAGIVALWLQASLDENAAHKNLTVNDVKNIMKETAITDSYTTTGANAAHFGNGKIDALAGIKHILGASSAPAIKASETAVSLEGYATMEYTKTISVTGSNLEGNITVGKSGSSTFTVDKTTIAQSNGVAQADITVTWKPTVAGTQTGTITLSSPNAESVSISLTGTAQAATPTIIANPERLTFTGSPNGNYSQTVNITGRFLTDNVTATLNDANGVFAVSPTAMTADNVMSDDGTALTVTFNSANEGTFSGTLTLASAGAQPVTISLSATANDGGTATDAYLNIAKYATIDDAGWTTTYVNNLYKYTEYESNEVAWLTMPVYGAWCSVYYSPAAQNWIKTNVTNTSSKYAGTTWSSNDELLGSSPYFTSASARAMGYNARNNYTQETVTFYVTNTTAVKLLGTGQSRSSSTYPATLKIYECSVNSDGSLDEGTSAVKSYSNSSTSGTFVLSATDLNASKIYKVEAATYRSLICEIGFQTPLQVEKTPALAANPTTIECSAPVGSSASEQFAVTGSYLTGNVTATLDDANGVFTLDKTSLTASQATSGSSNAIAVAFTPKAAQTYDATVTLTSEGAESVTVSLKGTGLQPTIIAEPETLTFDEIEAESTESLTFEVLAENLSEAVTATLADENGVFSIDATTIGIADAEEGKAVSVTFAPQAAGTYTGTVTLSSANAESVVVNLLATAKKKTPDYFDVTVTSLGLSTLYLDFPVEIPYEAYDPDLLGVYYIYDLSDRNELKLARLYSTIPANTGVIIQGNSGTFRFPKATGNVAQLTRNNYLSGVTEATTVKAVLEAAQSSGSVYTLQKGKDSYVQFYKYSGKSLAANKAFLILDDATAAKGLTFSLEDVETAIRSLDAEEESGEWFTIQGTRLSGKPAQAGIYIHNGKTVSIK